MTGLEQERPAVVIDQLLLHTAKEMQRTGFKRVLRLISINPLDFREHRRVDKVHERMDGRDSGFLGEIIRSL